MEEAELRRAYHCAFICSGGFTRELGMDVVDAEDNPNGEGIMYENGIRDKAPKILSYKIILFI